MSVPATIGTVDAVLAFAAGLTPVRETRGPDGRPDNRGRFVQAIQASTGGQPGDPWCADFVCYVGLHVLGGAWPLPRTGACETLHQFGKMHELLHNTPKSGDVFLLLNAEGHAHHTGFVEAVYDNGIFDTVEGNTNDNGSADGDGVYESARTCGDSVVFLRWLDA